MSKVLTIWKKELKDAIRDKRTLMAMIILPIVLMPVIIIGMSKITEIMIKQAEEQISTVGIVNQSAAPDFIELIKQNEKLELVEYEGELNEAVKNKDVDSGLIIPEDFQFLIESNQPVQLVLLQNSLSERSRGTLGRINIVAGGYNNQLIQSRLASEDVTMDVLTGMVIKTEELASEKELGGFGLGFIIPLFIVMWSIVGGQYIAVDISAGEKERKTLESILLTPAKRMEIVFGKFFAVATSAMISVLVSLTSMYFAVKYFGFFGMEAESGTGSALGLGAEFSIEPSAIIIMLGISILMVIMFSAVILSIAIFAKSYKEAQSYIGPSYLVVILPVSILNTMPGLEPPIWLFALPAVNAVTLFKEILVGNYNVGHIVLTAVTLAIYAVVAIYIAGKIYQKEGVLFKD